jgi:hypothetical protein
MIPGGVYVALGVLAILITLVEGYPWLSIQEGALLSPSNPYTELFTITNQGYVPLTDLGAVCVVNLEDPHNHISNSGQTIRNFARYLPHAGTATVPCFWAITARSVPSGARLDVVIWYAFYHLKFGPLLRKQTFHFQVITGEDGVQHWIYLA